MFFHSTSPPNGWTLSRLKDVARLNPEVLPETTDPDLEIQYVDIGNVSSDGQVLDTEVLAFADAPSRARRLVRSGDTIISTVRTYLRAVAYLAEPPTNFVVSTGFAVLRPLPVVHPPYLGWLVRSDPFIEAVMARSQGVSYPAIAPQELAGLLVWFPPVDQQRAVAGYLDRETAEIDAVVERRLRMVVLSDERRLALLASAFHGRRRSSPPHGEHPWTEDLPPGWRLARLGQLLLRNDSGVWGEDLIAGRSGVEVVRSTDMTEKGSWASNDPAIRELSEGERRAAMLREGDIVITKASGSRRHLGKAALVDGGMAARGVAFSNFMQRIRPRPELMSRYLWYFLNSSPGREQLLYLGTTTTGLANLNASIIGAISIPLPPLREQRDVVDGLDAGMGEVDRLSGRVTAHIRLLRERRSASITAAVTGQLDIRSVA